MTSEDEMPNSSAAEEPVRKAKRVSNADTETADTSLKRNQSRNNLKDKKQLNSLSSDNEIQISNRKNDIQTPS